MPRRDATLPDTLPRWDDLCVAVLALAEQEALLEYRRHDGSRYARPTGWRVTVVGAPPPPAPNIGAAHGLGPGWARQDVAALLAALGLVKHGAWTAAAEPVLWRQQADAWGRDVTQDPRFLRAVDQAVAALPDDLRAIMDGLATSPDAQAANRACDQLDDLLFRRWRLPEGWLSDADAARALEIFHDPLARAMRRAVMARIYPGLAVLRDRP